MYMCHAIDRQMIGVVVEPIKKEFGLSDTSVGVLAGLAYSVAFFIGCFPLGRLADRVNRRNLLAVLLSIWSGLTAVCGLATSYLGLLLARLGVGAAESGGQPTALSLMSDLFEPQERSTAIGYFYISVALGISASFLIGGWLAAHHGWRMVFFVAGIPGFVVAALLILTLKEPARRRAEGAGEEKEATPPFMEVVRHALRSATLLHLAAAFSLNSMTITAMWMWLSPFMMRLHHLSLETVGIIAAIAALAQGAGSALIGRLADHQSRISFPRLALVAATTTILSGTSGLIYAFAQPTAVAIGCFMLVSFLVGASMGPAYSILLASAPSRMRATIAAGLQAAINLIGVGLGPLLTGMLSDAFGGPASLRPALAITLSINFWAAAHFLLVYRAMKRSAAAEGMPGNANPPSSEIRS